MMIELDEVIRVGAVTVAALVKRSVHFGSARAVSIYGAKCPVAVLVRRDDVTMAFEIDGPQIALDDLERRYPGRCSEFERFTMTSFER